MYSNVTPPTLPSYDSVANPYYLIQFEYAIGAENWETVRFWFGAAPLTWNGSAVTNAVAFSLYTWGTGSPEWTAWGVMAEAGEMALTPGPTTADTYMRLYTNHDILDGSGAVWLSEGTVTPTEEDKEAEIQIRIKSKLAGIIAAWCAPVRQFPKPTAEPVAFLYNGVRLPGLPVVEGKEFMEILYVIPQNDYHKIGYYMVTAYSTPYYVNPEDGKTYYSADGEYTYFSAWNTDGSIRDGFEEPQTESYSKDEWAGTFSSNLIWTNFDVCDSTGKVLLAGSEPVPVYE